MNDVSQILAINASQSTLDIIDAFLKLCCSLAALVSSLCGVDDENSADVIHDSFRFFEFSVTLCRVLIEATQKVF